MTSAIIAAILGLLLIAGAIFVLARYCRKVFVGPASFDRMKKERNFFVLACGISGAAFLLLELAIFLNNPSWSSKTVYGATELFAGRSINYSFQMSIGLIGAYLFGSSLISLIMSILIYTKKKNIDKPSKKANLIMLFASIVVIILGFVGWTEGVAPYLTYPLINGFTMNFSAEQFWTWTTVKSTSSGGLHVAFYGIIILMGLLLCYVICSYKFYNEYHKKGLLDTTAIAGFIGGILGARIWYVVGNYSREFASQVAAGDIGSLFRIWEGGLTILGGAIAGVLCGYLWLKLFVKVANPRFAIDVCVPTILLAQALGRWGNFFNCEVYGQVVSVDGFSWLPSWLLSQMNVTTSGTTLGPGLINVPLFFIEGVANIAGYFLIVYATKPLNKWLALGDRGGLYFIWYGLVRVIMEPMRNTTFNMGTDNSWSICNSIAYIFIGAAFILALHIYEYLLKHPDRKWMAVLVAGASVLIGVFMPFIPSVNGVITNESVTSYSGFSIIFSGASPLYLVSFILLVLVLAWIIVYAILLRKNEEKFKKFYDVSFYGILGSLVVLALLFVLGTPSISFDVAYDDVNASYGFVLVTLWCVVAASVMVSILLSEKTKKKEEKKEEPQVVEEAQ